MRPSHRARLALAASGAGGAVLAILFFAVAFSARRSLLHDKRAELGAIVQSFMPPGDPTFDLEEFHEAHPELSAAVYRPDGRRVGAAGKAPPPHFLGSLEGEGRLGLGRPFRGDDVVVSLDIRETERGLQLLTAVLAVGWLPLTFLIGAVTWAAAGAVFRPLRRLSAQALAMSGADLSERLVTPDVAEFGDFARDLNLMLDRIEETVRRGERFSVDAAHELRTPLALLRVRLETALLQRRTPEQYETAIRRSVGEIDRLGAIVDTLLRSARGEAAEAHPCALEPLVQEALDRWRDRFTARGVGLESRTVSAAATILPEEVRVLLDNLLGNALRYAPERTPVHVLLGSEESYVRLSVRDEGPGVPSELGERIFDRFVRADDSRNRASGGAGIGLAVCRQIVEGRGGKMILGDRPEGGAEVGFRLPASSDRSGADPSGG